MRHAGQRKVVLLAKPQPVVHREDAVNADALRDLVEVDVARLAQRADHVHSAMTTALPAVEPSAGDLDIAIAGDSLFRVHQPGFQRGQRIRHLDRRSRRIGPLHRLVASGRNSLSRSVP